MKALSLVLLVFSAMLFLDASSADRALPLAPLKTVTITTDEGTWMSLDVSPDGTHIAFDLLGQIFVMPIDGGQARQLTQGPEYNEAPQFTRDGAFVVYTSDRGGTEALWRIPVSGGGPARVPAHEATRFRLADFSQTYQQVMKDKRSVYRVPNGRYTVSKYNAFTNLQGWSITCVPSTFLLTDASTGVTRRLASAGSDCGGALMPASAFTPDSRAFITAYGGKIRRIAVPSGQTQDIPFRATVRLRIRPLTRPSVRVPETPQVQARRIAGATLSPDRTRVAFSAFGRVWVASLANPKPARLTSLDVGEFWPAWSPDGRYVAFVTWTDSGPGDGAIYRMRADGTDQPERLTSAPGVYFGLTYAGDGTHLYAFRRQRPPTQGSRLSPKLLTDDHDGRPIYAPLDVIRVPAAGGVVEPVPDIVSTPPMPSQNWVTGLHVAPPGTRNRVTKFLREEMMVVAAGGDASPEILLKLRDDVNAVNVMLSPTGTRALVMTETMTLYLVDVPPRQGDEPLTLALDLKGTRAQRITPLERGAEFPQWQRDGRSFTYVFGDTLYVVEVPPSGPASAPRAVRLAVSMPRDQPTGTLALRNARLITMRSHTCSARPSGRAARSSGRAEVIERGDLVITDRRIVALGPTGRVPIPSDAHVVDVAGKTILPGLFDLHNHISPWPGVMSSRVLPFEANLSYGVFTARDPQAGDLSPLSYQDQLETGLLLGPRYLNTGPGIPEPSGDVIGSLADARRVVGRYADVYGTRYLKEYALERRDARQWLAMAAAERGLTITTHSAHMHELKEIVQHVVDGYGGQEHLWFIGGLYHDVRQLLVMSGLTLSHLHYTPYHQYDLVRLSKEASARAKRVYPTETFERLQLIRLPSVKESPELEAIITRERDIFDPHAWMSTVESLTQLVSEGGRVVTSSHGNQPGLGTHLEMWTLAMGGMTPIEILRGATVHSAEALGLDQDLGSLEVGKLGDVLILDQNPLENIRHTNSISSIVFNGRLRDAITLEERWPERRALPPVWWRQPARATESGQN